jgi:hypothetical protein
VVTRNEAAAVCAGSKGGRRPVDMPARTAIKLSGASAAGPSLRLKEADQAAGSGETGASPRRHGLYSSGLANGAARRAGNVGRADAGKKQAKPPNPTRRQPNLRPLNTTVRLAMAHSAGRR